MSSPLTGSFAGLVVGSVHPHVVIGAALTTVAPRPLNEIGEARIRNPSHTAYPPRQALPGHSAQAGFIERGWLLGSPVPSRQQTVQPLRRVTPLGHNGT